MRVEIGTRCTSAIAALATSFAALVRAQSVPRPTFEVVSIRPCRPDTPRARTNHAPPSGPTEILRIECQTVERLIEDAYSAYATGKLRFRGSPVAIEGAPAWIRSERYTIQAKADAARSRGVMHGPMLQRILEDRFGLKLRREPKKVPIYVLTVAKGGPKNLHPAKPGACLAWDLDHLPAIRQVGGDLCGMIGRRINAGNAEVEILGTTMANFAEQLQILVDRDVIDKTGISGVFDIHVEVPVEDLTADASAGRPDDGAPRTPADESALAFAAVRKLGLKLESAEGPGEVFLIDHVERPSEN
jgi:uncharacterized protein (TIGR03435 family)